MKNVAASGMFRDMTNSFLVLAGENKDSSIRRKLLGSQLDKNEVAWHYSLRRKTSATTTFTLEGKGIQVAKEYDTSTGGKPEDFVGNEFTVRWREIPKEPATPGVHMRTLLTNYVYYGFWPEFLNDIHQFLTWSFDKWKVAGDEGHLHADSLEALLINAMVSTWTPKSEDTPEPGRYAVFDLEYTLDRPVKKSWFILRNVRCLEADHPMLPSLAPFHNLEQLYGNLCRYMNVKADFEVDTLLEAKFMALVADTWAGASEQDLHAVLKENLVRPVGNVRWPRDPNEEYDHEAFIGKYQRSSDVYQQTIRELEAVLNTRFHRMAQKMRERMLKLSGKG
jgi:hypothetical protein